MNFPKFQGELPRLILSLLHWFLVAFKRKFKLSKTPHTCIRMPFLPLYPTFLHILCGELSVKSPALHLHGCGIFYLGHFPSCLKSRLRQGFPQLSACQLCFQALPLYHTLLTLPGAGYLSPSMGGPGVT